MRAPTEKQIPAITDLSRLFCQPKSQTSRRDNRTDITHAAGYLRYYQKIITLNNCMIDIR